MKKNEPRRPYPIHWVILLVLSLLAWDSVSAGQFLVAVDTGHSKSEMGAISSTGIGEYHFNEAIVSLLLSRAAPNGRKKLVV